MVAVNNERIVEIDGVKYALDFPVSFMDFLLLAGCEIDEDSFPENFSFISYQGQTWCARRVG